MTVRMQGIAAGLAASMLVPTAWAESGEDAIRQELKRLMQRLEQLEASNKQLQARVSDVETESKDPSMEMRLADMEVELVSLRNQARSIEQIKGISAGASLLMVAQNAVSGASEGKGGQANYRADVSVTLPGGEIGESDGRVFAHFRLGQGEGVGLNHPGFSSTANSTAFQLSNGDDTAAVLAQAWYQLDVPLNGTRGQADQNLEVNFGKIDPFVFFDQNGIADDESSRFLNNVFVHNPMLDSGGAVGVDGYGFTPGVRLAYHVDGPAGNGWRASIGAFGAGEGASFKNTFHRPFLIGQLEHGHQFDNGLAGNYRFYVWTNGSATPYANPADASLERHSGWGLSFDHPLSSRTTVFARYGHATQGRVRFDQALTAGLEFSGTAWGRENDRLAIAGGWLHASKSFRADSLTLDADGAGGADFGYLASGAEHLAEIYYTWQINEQFELTPDVQWISRLGADAAAKDVVFLGLRAKMGF